MLALQALCLFDSLGDSFAQQLEEFLHDSHVHADLGFETAPHSDVLAFARQLAAGAWRDRRRYDELLSQTATGWSLTRMTPVDRNTLRLGLHELLEHPATPPEVVINEAIELARLLADENSPGFVNGVLDAVRRRLGIGDRPREADPARPAADSAGQDSAEDGPTGPT